VVNKYLEKHCQMTLLSYWFAEKIVCCQLFPDLEQDHLYIPAWELVVVVGCYHSS